MNNKKKFELLKKHFGTKNNGQLFIDLSGIDFEDHNIVISGSKTKKNLYAASFKANAINNSAQCAKNIFNNDQVADHNIFNNEQKSEEKVYNTKQDSYEIVNKNQKSNKTIY